ncbi:Oxygen-dependent choline dehydrogenase [Aliiroseovarius sp. xm-m-379]|uniref:choline dehydrogenase n=1 Tax=unclassified Aliiroseovarius TaxID=2623558 RepID=UPI00156A1B12|nr:MULTISPECIES: choline dehydrogenase [unclassified Aliiroseovarius]NRP11264.1 Oxygen-dependent choline dehydrogenase [Aliiroseovarius sp. xm-d-517]NRP23762.1 Oxygen-dependent choline dehydrogenase [Aliiroseovarius sp. xm-m-379]NRP28992.1 Oxygen-dependent choline dehydrogenase [Aliiroseovarius sp. xm-m-314]NRP32561.1 Oxygen-dependent choline dehydrogenase [Aliiroseovarius sp. xm-a-104]NRP41094.1 Oxygen-dependent choline dehydrogenase [Aliiroseovarius sp. xm-m-339-2]
MQEEYVIIGAGSAGCAMAYRLSEAGKKVIVIEHGGTDAGPFIQMPAALSYPMNMKTYDWGFQTEPEPHLGGRTLVTPRGKVIGGSSSINGMVYVRGHARDFDHWAEQGADGWSYADVLPYFKRQETWHSGGHGGDEDWRGRNGPLHVTRGPRRNPLFHAFVEAGAQAGYPVTGDYNGQQQEGFGPMEQTVWQGRRWSAANAYLRPAQKTGNCEVVRAFARKVVIEDGRATGVEVERGGKIEVIRAQAEVIIAASSINSPKLLMLSGIGPAAHLKEHGIEVVADRAGVGQNLQDHLEVYMQYASKQPITLYRYWNLFWKGVLGAQWLFTKKGLGASNQFESAAFIRSRAGVEYPDIQYHFLPIAVRYDGQAAAEGHGFQAHVGPMRSPSRGEITLKSADPKEAPRIFFNYMSTDQDWEDFRTCLRLTREIFSQAAFEPFVKHEIQPGVNYQSDDELDDFIREHAESAYHPCGTCRMGRADDPTAVVDPEMRVIGVEGLRLADSSVFPRITNGNLNAPSIMVGEKASDHILGRQLPRANEGPWINPNWETSQR